MLEPIRVPLELTRMSPREARARIEALGYRLHAPVRYRRCDGKQIRAFSIMEADTGLGYCHYTARRDARFEALQELRFGTLICDERGIEWQLG